MEGVKSKMKLKIESGIEFPSNSRANSVTQGFWESIANMQVGDSFEISSSGNSYESSIHGAFRRRGWKCYIHKTSAKNASRTIRVWRKF